jgi:D-galactarolactone cycloisomerase
MAFAYGLRYVPHVWGSGVALAAALQLLAVLPALTPPSLNPLEPILEFDRTEHPIRQALLISPIEHNGRVAVPQGPGLGIEIDRSALDRFRVR